MLPTAAPDHDGAATATSALAADEVTFSTKLKVEPSLQREREALAGRGARRGVVVGAEVEPAEARPVGRCGPAAGGGGSRPPPARGQPRPCRRYKGLQLPPPARATARIGIASGLRQEFCATGYLAIAPECSPLARHARDPALFSTRHCTLNMSISQGITPRHRCNSDECRTRGTRWHSQNYVRRGCGR